MNCQDESYSMNSLEYIVDGHLQKDDDGYGMYVGSDKFLERNNKDASFSKTKVEGFNKLFPPPSFSNMNSEEIADFVNSRECLFDRHRSEDGASYSRDVAMDAPRDRINLDHLLSMTNGKKLTYLFPGFVSRMSYQDITGSLNIRECLLDGRPDVAVNFVLERNLKDPLFSKTKGGQFKELFTPSSSQMKYEEIPDSMNSVEHLFDGYPSEEDCSTNMVRDNLLDRNHSDCFFSKTNEGVTDLYTPLSYTWNHEEILDYTNNLEGLFDGDASTGDVSYRMDRATNNLLDMNTAHPRFAMRNGKWRNDSVMPSSDLPYFEEAKGKKFDGVNNADPLFSEYEGKRKHDLLSPHNENNDGMVECHEPLDVNGQPKTSDDYAEWCRQLDESLETKGYQCVASDIETEATVSHT